MSIDSQECDLGSFPYGDSKSVIDTQFHKAGMSNQPKCIICKQPAKYRLIPKNDRVNTIEIQDKGYICEGCVSVGAVSSNDFGLRPLY